LTLWDYARLAYARPGCEAACLALQDDFGQCIPLLLWALWTTIEDRHLDDGTIEAAASAAHIWDETAIAPLRLIRRRLKRRFPPMSDHARDALREDVKAAELSAERLLLETLEAMTSAGPGGTMTPDEALTAVSEAWGAAAPGPALGRLAAAAL
jgi:uncharacterized protein (TIGR02444 family)